MYFAIIFKNLNERKNYYQLAEGEAMIYLTGAVKEGFMEEGTFGPE